MEQDSAEHKIKKIIPEKVKKNFSRAAGTYEKNASLQKQVAEKLAILISQELQSSNPPKLIYEGGCGTGFLTVKLLQSFPNANFAVSDISKEMLDICRRKTAKFAEKNARKIDFYLYDLNNGAQFIGVDLFAVSMALQWVDETERFVRTVFDALSPDGIFAFSVLGDETFASIRSIFKELSIVYPFSNFFDEHRLSKLCSDFEKIRMERELLTFHFSSYIDFFRHMKKIGSINPQAGNLSVSELRRALKKMNSIHVEDGIFAEFEVFYCVCQKSE